MGCTTSLLSFWHVHLFLFTRSLHLTSAPQATFLLTKQTLTPSSPLARPPSVYASHPPSPHSSSSSPLLPPLPPLGLLSASPTDLLGGLPVSAPSLLWGGKLTLTLTLTLTLSLSLSLLPLLSVLGWDGTWAFAVCQALCVCFPRVDRERCGCDQGPPFGCCRGIHTIRRPGANQSRLWTAQRSAAASELSCTLLSGIDVIAGSIPASVCWVSFRGLCGFAGTEKQRRYSGCDAATWVDPPRRDFCVLRVSEC